MYSEGVGNLLPFWCSGLWLQAAQTIHIHQVDWRWWESKVHLEDVGLSTPWYGALKILSKPPSSLPPEDQLCASTIYMHNLIYNGWIFSHQRSHFRNYIFVPIWCPKLHFTLSNTVKTTGLSVWVLQRLSTIIMKMKGMCAIEGDKLFMVAPGVLPSIMRRKCIKENEVCISGNNFSKWALKGCQIASQETQQR